MRAAVVAVLAALAAAAPAQAAPVTETSTSGTVRAELTYETHDDRAPTNILLRIFDNEVLTVEDRVPDDDFETPLGVFDDRDSVRAIDLDGDSAAEVLLDLYSGGAHCCVHTRIYSGTHSFDHFFGNPTYELEDFDGDGLPEFRTADNRFDSRYSAYAYTTFPLAVLRFTRTRLRDVTADVAKLALRAEVRKLRRRYARLSDENRVAARDTMRSTLAAYAADKCNLGECKSAFKLLRSAEKRGDTRPYKNFTRTVALDLKRWGYR